MVAHARAEPAQGHRTWLSSMAGCWTWHGLLLRTFAHIYPHLWPWYALQNTETLLAKEREAREAAAKELLQYRLLLAEAEADRNAAQQQLQASQVRATREAAATAELRGQVEALQVRDDE